AAVGIAHSVSGQIVKAFVIRGEEDITSRELQSFCKDRLAHYKTPRVIEFVDDFPRNSLGKVLRRKLREW
ncbi:MAG: AMP-dependent synthetase, partial [Synergistales bacterium]|nr:AMP-dependent synthetase [Synergistales bacterium]